MSRFGAHVKIGSRNDYGPFCDAKPAVVIGVDEGGSLVEARQKSGGHTITIFRDTTIYLEAPPDFNTYPDMVALARHWYPQLKAKWLQNPADYYTITNEQGGQDPAVMRRLVDYEREVMRLANADGLKVCVLNLATGTPESLDTWGQILAPFIVEAWAGRNIYGRHAYGSGDLVDNSGSAIPGDPTRPFAELGYLRSLGAAGGIALTECGLDAGFGFAGTDRFKAQMSGYEKLLRAYPEFVGLCAWTLGHWVGPGGQETNWQDALPAMTQYLSENPTPKWEWPGGGTPPPPPGDDNLLPNPSFEGGWWHIDGRPELQIANGYTVTWKEGEISPGGQPYVTPEYRVLPAAFLPPAERPLFILDGQQTIKVFKGYGAINTTYEAEPITLSPGRYRFTVPVYPDAVMDYSGGQKVFADDPLAAEARIIHDGIQEEWANLFPFGNWRQLVYEFELAETRPIKLGVRFRNRWGLQNSGWFADAWRLERTDETPPPPPTPDYLHTRLTSPANIRRDPSTNAPAITPVAVKEGLELIKVGNVTGQTVSGNNQWVKAVAFISRSYATDSAPGKVKTNRSVNLRVVPTTAVNWPLVLLPAGVEFEHLGNIKDFYNDGQWAAVALYVWKPLTADVVPGIRFGKLLPSNLSITSPFNAPRSYPFAPEKKQLHEGLDFGVPIGTPVLAGAVGVVDFVRTVDPGYGYGKTVRIKHSDRYTTWLGHLSRVDVTVGQQVTAGQQVALSGNSGGSSGPHLHLTLVDNPGGVDGYVIDNVTDPTLYLHPAVSLEPGQEPPPGDGVDLRLFKVAHPDAWRVVRGVDADGNQYSEDVQDMELSGGLYVRRKNNNAEWHKRDATFFYLVHDTSPAPGAEGIQRVYSLYKNGQPGAPKSKVVQAVGEVWQEAGTHLVQFRARDDCRPLSENSGNAQNSSVITAHEKNYRFNTYGQNLVFDEVIFEKTGVETQIYARHQGKAVGWIGWSAPWGSAEPVELYWNRGRMTQEPNRYCQW